MSAQHTKGRMKTDETDHETPYEDIHLVIGRHKVACVWIDDAPVPDYNREQQANARRLVACWNACEGIETEHLERHGLPDFAQKTSDLNAQRDELLAALIALRGACASAGWLTNSAHIAHMEDARAAIAKVEGGAA